MYEASATEPVEVILEARTAKTEETTSVSKESETVFAAGEYLGTLEYEGKEFAPLVNLLGFEAELGAIESHEAPPQVLQATVCGPLIEGMFGTPCAPPAFAGEDMAVTAKTEGLEIKA
jgi:hypothetical protein